MRKIIFIFLFSVFLANSSLAGISVVGSLVRNRSVNSGESICHAKIYQNDYLFYADGNNNYGKPGNTSRSNAGWISLSPNQLSIPPKDTASVYYKVQVPESPDLKGTYWSVVMVEETSAESKEGNKKNTLSLKTVVRYAVQIVTNISDTGISKIEFSDKKLIQKDGKKILQIDIRNTGERKLRPYVWVQLYNKSGIDIGRFESSRSRIYPDCSVRHKIDLTDVSKGQYKALVVVDNGDEHVFGGQYDLKIK